MLNSLSVLDFKYPWRSYQQKLLNAFNRHIADHHFHVIAPPGSGKTILGIEIVKRLGKKTLVLAPTLTIRNQWENRLQTFFTEAHNFEAFSFDIKAPSDVTFSTYQSLHAFYKSFGKKEDYFKFFKKHNIEVIVLDEAHHLKNEWWKCLIALKNENPFYIVALTATPPYDSSKTEITKYFTLCGAVDDEIAVPDLVRENDLCPHQDFVYFSKPNDLEINFIVEYRRKIADFRNELLQDKNFISFLQNHRFYKNTAQFLEEIYTNTAYFSSLLIFLNACGIKVDKDKLELLGFYKNETIKFPDLDLNWLQILLQNLLVVDREQLIKDEIQLNKLGKKLRRLNVFSRNRINFIGEHLLYKSLAYSPSKLKSIVNIVKAERASLGDNLNCVILADYIQKEFLSTNLENINTINKIGVIPIFQHLRAQTNNNELAVLTGSLVIIHRSILDEFGKIEHLENFSFTSLAHISSFLVVTTKKKTKKSVVSILTTLFENGTIKVLIGTKSLLGEGWDAPSINSLILASFVGSFVSSNQMRGRAIRKDADKPQKTGNIWHLACVDPTAEDGGREVAILKCRFEAFVGITNTTIPYISNGFDRLNIPQEFALDTIDDLNKTTLKSANSREKTHDKWKTAIGNGTKLTKQVKLLQLGDKPFNTQKRVYYFDALRFFIAELSAAILLFYLEFILEAFNLIFSRGFTYAIYAFIAAFVVRFGYKLYKAITLYIRHGFQHKKIKKIGLSILESMDALSYLTTDFNAITINSELQGKGDVVCHLIGASNYENEVFSNALTQVLEPIDSPRYLIIKTSFFRKKLNIQNFYTVPDIFGDKKENAIIFKEFWKQYLGRSKLIFTRQKEGRKLLIKARLFHIYNAFTKTTREVTIWK